MTGPEAGAGGGSRDALLIATGAYDDPALRPLRSPRQDCSGLAAVLGDPMIGDFRVEQLVDTTASETRRSLERFFRNRSRHDLLLLHLSCHGLKDDDGRLYFAARDTEKDLPASTAVSAAFLHELMARCRARTIVVLLDCCYSGAFLPGTRGDDSVHVREELSGNGRAVITATSRTEYAWEGGRLERAAPQPSEFTGALIEGLRTGDADGDGDGRISVTELYDYVYEYVHRGGARQTPRMWAELEYRVTIARVRVRRGQVQEVQGAGEPFPGRRRRGTDARIALDLELVEMALGTTKDITVDTAALCEACEGAGTAPGTTSLRCAHCAGEGDLTAAADGGGEPVPCPVCRGRGRFIPSPCHACEGEGRVGLRRTLTIKIPAGVEPGTFIRFSGEGEVGLGGGPAADLYVETRQLPHPDLERHGDDLRHTVDVSGTLARRGGTIQVPTLEGRRTVRLPAGLTSGQTVRLPRLGAMRLDGSGRGHLLIWVRVTPEG
ncbi:caspase, EACC1-associated type [Streptomyces sp. SBT349]|uniref:caspase, EACC1-associated type n=1 Tax=Streptomyces sp. SBT349 TaxID=1580539 RepID=UPI00066D1B86|nr:DnaJ C-terminal domain-containing protein [Streptomyces sp. SBT349]